MSVLPFLHKEAAATGVDLQETRQPVPLRIHDKIWLYSHLANYTKAGFGFDQALRSLMEQARGAERRGATEAARRVVRSGGTLSQALSTPEVGALPMESAILRAAESSGMLEQAFAYLSGHFESVRQTRITIRAQLLYPGILVHLGILLPAIPAYIRTQSFASSIGLALVMLLGLYAFVIAFGLVSRVLWKRAVTDCGIDRVLRSVPLVGGLRRAIGLERFSNVLRMQIECGQLISTGVAAAGEASGSAVLAEAGQRLSETARGGSPLGSEILTMRRAFPDDFATAIRTAEQTGMLGEELTRWSHLYRRRVVDQFGRLAAWAPRVVYLLVALFVAWQIISLGMSIYAPVLDLLDE